MANMNFVYGTMESGKTTKLLQDCYNFNKHNIKTIIIKPLLDTKGGNTVVARNNSSAKVDFLLAANDSIFNHPEVWQDTRVILIDEAQFLKSEQIKDFWLLAHRFNVQVICYGIKSDFRGIPFEGTSTLFGYSDNKTELTVPCECGQTAVFNARKVNGKFTLDGDILAIDGENEVSYVPLCSECFLKQVYGPNEKVLVRTNLKKKNNLL